MAKVRYVALGRMSTLNVCAIQIAIIFREIVEFGRVTEKHIYCLVIAPIHCAGISENALKKFEHI